MTPPEGSCPEAMVGGEEELIESNDLNDDLVEHIRHKKSPYFGDSVV